MAPIRRPVAVQPPAPPSLGFGSLAFYSGGFRLPEGDYAMEHNVIMHTYTKADGSPSGFPPTLGVMLTAHPLAGGEVQEQFLGMGRKAHLSFAPSADGKGVVAVPGGPAQTASKSTNWNYYLKSMYDCGLPDGVFTNDISVLDGIHVHTQNVPEPEERKGFAARTGDVEEERKGDGLTTVVGEIKEDGKPWEGTGGIPTPGTATPQKIGVGKVMPKAAPGVNRTVARPAPVAVPEVQEAAGDEDVMIAAVQAATTVLEQEKNAAGCTKILFRVETFKAIEDADMKQAVQNTFFGSDDALNSLIGQLGYVVSGQKIIPQA